MKKTLLAMALLTTLSSAHADGYTGLAASANHRESWGAGNPVGTGYRVFLGVDLGPYAAAEGGHTSFGTAESDEALHSAKGWDVSVLSRLPLGYDFSVLGRAGYLAWTSRFNAGERHAEDVFFGAGLEYGSSVRFRVEFTRYPFDENRMNAATISLISAIN